MNWNSRDIAGGAVISALGTLTSRVLGLVREILIAVAFGTRSSADIFFAAFAIPNLFRQLLGEGAFSAAFIPTLAKIQKEDGDEEAVAFTSSAVWMLSAALLFVTGFGILFAEQLVTLVVGGFAMVPGKLEQAITLTRIMFPYLFFVGLAALAMAALNTRNHFWSSAVSPAAFNAVSIMALLIIRIRMQNQTDKALHFLAWSALVGGLLQVVVQIPALRKHGYQLRAPAFHPGLKRVLYLMVPAVFGLAIMQINIVVDKRFASFLPEGGISYLNYANRIMQFPLGTFGIAVATATVPAVASCLAAGDMGTFRKHYGLGIRLASFVLLPCTFLLIGASRPVTALLFERGQFGPESTVGSAGALACYSLGLLAYSCVKITGPAFYSMGSPSVPIRAGVIAMLANILFNAIFIVPLQHRGLALSTAISGFLNAGMLMFWLRKQTGGIGGFFIARGVLFHLALSAIIIWPCIFLMENIHVILTIPVSMTLYFCVARLTGAEEPVILLNLINKKARIG